jgi:amino acid transporter
MDVNYQIGGVLGAATFLLLLSLLVHWIVRKIRRRPRKQFREWLTSWIAGPELLILGLIGQGAFQRPGDELPFLLAYVLQWVGLTILVIKIIASIISRFRRRAPASPPVSSAASPTAPPLGRQPPLG